MELAKISTALQNVMIFKKEKAQTDQALIREQQKHQNTAGELGKISRELQQSKINLIEIENKHEEEKAQLQQALIKEKQKFQELLDSSWVSGIKKIWEWLIEW